MISKESFRQNENQSTASFTQSVLHTSQSAEPHSVLNDITDLHSGSSFPSPYSWVTNSSQSGNLSRRPHSEQHCSRT